MQFLLNKKLKSNSEEKQNNSNSKKNIKNESENKNIRKSSKLYSINNRNRINKKMNEIEKKSKYKRNIYNLLYDQVHADVREIEKEIKIAKDLIVPYSLLKRRQIKYEILLNKNLSKADIDELQKEKNISTTINKIDVPKIKNFSIVNNSLYSNTTTLNTSGRKDNKSSTFITFSKFKNKNNVINIKTRNKPTLNIIRAITDKNIGNNISLFNKENDIFETNISKMNYNNNEYPNSERNNINNIFNRINSKTLSKNATKTTLMKVNPETKTPKRKKCLYVSYDQKWYLRNKFISIKLDKLEIENNYIQSKIISDEYALINENIKLITSKYLVDKELTNKFNSTNYSNQLIINNNIEKSIGLMLKISYILLEKYEDNLENFITQTIKKPKKKDYKLVEDEKKEFTINITLFTETSSFFSVSFKSYMILLEKDEYFKIDKNNFDKIHQFLDRLRLSMNKVILDLKNLYYGSNSKERKIIKDCVQKIIKIKEQKEVYEKKKKLDCHRRFGIFRSGIDPFKYKGKLEMKITEDKEINMRIDKALGKKYNAEKNFSNVKKFDIGSKLVTNLMRYGTKEFREFIIYERIRKKFFDKEKENDIIDDSK